MSAPDEHDVLIKACQVFAAAHSGDPLLPVVRGFEAWHTLRAGRPQEAFALWESDLKLPASPLNECAKRLACGWMSRADREKVVASLQAYYRREVAYPKNLELIAAHPRLKNEPKAPEKDRFGNPWSYTLTGFEKTKGFPDQKYSLKSSVLGDLSDLQSAASLVYASKITAVPQRVITMPNNTSAVSFNLGKSVSMSMAGPGQGDLHLAFIGAKFIVVCDHTHWKILPRP